MLILMKLVFILYKLYQTFLYIGLLLIIKYFQKKIMLFKILDIILKLLHVLFIKVILNFLNKLLHKIKIILN